MLEHHIPVAAESYILEYQIYVLAWLPISSCQTLSTPNDRSFMVQSCNIYKRIHGKQAHCILKVYKIKQNFEVSLTLRDGLKPWLFCNCSPLSPLLTSILEVMIRIAYYPGWHAGQCLNTGDSWWFLSIFWSLQSLCHVLSTFISPYLYILCIFTSLYT